eukprot:2693521-Rhodomonas_salina.1
MAMTLFAYARTMRCPVLPSSSTGVTCDVWPRLSNLHGSDPHGSTMQRPGLAEYGEMCGIDLARGQPGQRQRTACAWSACCTTTFHSKRRHSKRRAKRHDAKRHRLRAEEPRHEEAPGQRELGS